VQFLDRSEPLKSASTIRLLASTNNERGDLFTRLVKDLFFALGYDDLRLDVHKSGRELDIQGKHRFEPRLVIAECKAHAAKMGGEELNKFLGVLTRERNKNAPTLVAGYFLSLSGFTETAVEQEIEMKDERIILMDSKQIIDELQKCRAVAESLIAVERAGKCIQHAGLKDSAFDGVELLGHQLGYIWTIYYTQDKQRTHFSLVHADGTPLAGGIAAEIIQADYRCGGQLHSLNYLAPPGPSKDRVSLEAATAASYHKWLSEECGYIQLDGLPADTDLSATRLKLERLFVPLKATFLSNRAGRSEAPRNNPPPVLTIGEMLEQTLHLALLAAPGGGKTTLLKRLATAYAFPERRSEVFDNLPRREWLPLILRCRELRDRAHRPILELLDDIPRHAGMGADECSEFREMIHASLRSGRALLLIDGLDEISEKGARQTFANHLRTFIAMFPEAALIITSREAGFRLVAGVVASVCQQARLAPLDEDDVLSLCDKWSSEVVRDTERVRSEAKRLGHTIWENGRIRPLAENPLLLTTLLVVKRYIGELPRSRTVLYREAIRVLVRTWNVEGYAPLDEDETLAQLSYLACSMMEEGKQQIGKEALLHVLKRAHRELEAELQFARISPEEFIERIEYRSSLLMQVGNELIDGVLESIYEFRHLTFQEYLAARGYAEQQYPGRTAGQDLVDVLGSHFEDERWEEVIALAAVLAGARAEELIKRLIACSYGRGESSVTDSRRRLSRLICQCIRDEVKVTTATLRSALEEIGRNPETGPHFSGELTEGKLCALFCEIVEQKYLAGGPESEQYVQSFQTIVENEFFVARERKMSKAISHELFNAFLSGDRNKRIRAALVTLELAFHIDQGIRGKKIGRRKGLEKEFRPLINHLTAMLELTDVPSAVAASWALVWVAESRMIQNPTPELIGRLFDLWRHTPSNRYAAWALIELPLLPRDALSGDAWADCDQFLLSQLNGENAPAALLIGWYRRSPWSDSELTRHIKEYDVGRAQSVSRQLLRNLGDVGLRALEELESRKPVVRAHVLDDREQDDAAK
jgi:hypothetical protein